MYRLMLRFYPTCVLNMVRHGNSDLPLPSVLGLTRWSEKRRKESVMIALLCNHYLLMQTNDSMSLSITCKSKGHHILRISSISGCFCVEKRHNTKFPPWYSVPCNFVVGRFASRLIRWGGRFKDDTCPNWLQVYHLNFLACYTVVSPGICYHCTTSGLYLFVLIYWHRISIMWQMVRGKIRIWMSRHSTCTRQF